MRTNFPTATGPLLAFGLALPLLTLAPPARVTCQLALDVQGLERCGEPDDDHVSDGRAPARPSLPSSVKEIEELAEVDDVPLRINYPSVADPLLLTTMRLEEAVLGVTELHPDARAAASTAAIELVNEDPLHRAGAMLGALVADVVGAHHREGPGVGPFAPSSAAWSRIEALADGTAAHLALLEALGVAPLPPLDHGYLSSLSNESLERIRGPEAIDASSSGALRKVIEKLSEFLLCYDRSIQRRVEAADAVLLERVPGYPRANELRVWRDELRVTSEAARAWSARRGACSDEQRARARRYADDAEELVALLDDYLGQGC